VDALGENNPDSQGGDHGGYAAELAAMILLLRGLLIELCQNFGVDGTVG
jgi:hypothetical protein